MKKIIFPLALAAVAMAISTVSMDVCARSLAQIKESGVLKVGSTGDYKPMSYLNKETGKYEGFDAEMAESLAKYLGVKLEYVPTKWKTLQQDTMDDKFDVGISGITVTDARRKVMTMSDGYLTFGKTILVTKGKEGQFKSLADVNKPAPLTLHRARIGHRHEYAAMRFGTQPHHTACLRIVFPVAFEIRAIAA